MNTYGQQKEEKRLSTEMLLLFSLIVAEHGQVQYLSFAPLVIIAIKTCYTFGVFFFREFYTQRNPTTECEQDRSMSTVFVLFYDVTPRTCKINLPFSPLQQFCRQLLSPASFSFLPVFC